MGGLLAFYLHHYFPSVLIALHELIHKRVFGTARASCSVPPRGNKRKHTTMGTIKVAQDCDIPVRWIPAHGIRLSQLGIAIGMYPASNARDQFLRIQMRTPPSTRTRKKTAVQSPV